MIVDLKERSYPIYIGQNLLTNIEYYQPYIKSSQVLVVTNETIAPLYLKMVCDTLKSDYQVETVILPDGEQYKCLETVNKIFNALLENKFNRSATLLALGGGVIGDMGGFAAACYQRGINFIQLPTTLLAQVDSSVGGKTGVNHPLGKNMIGAFYQPRCVIIDTTTLMTLEDRELSAGLAEVIKYGLITDPEFFIWLECNIDAMLKRDPDVLSYAIKRSCQNKAEVVAKDEFESGVRALLNMGHTFGHAIETGEGYGQWLHGEAVSIGTCMAADLSLRHGWLSSRDVERIQTIHQYAHLPIKLPENMSTDKFLSLMAVDKKVLDGQLRLVLLKSIGEAIVTADFNHDLLNDTLNQK